MIGEPPPSSSDPAGPLGRTRLPTWAMGQVPLKLFLADRFEKARICGKIPSPFQLGRPGQLRGKPGRLSLPTQNTFCQIKIGPANAFAPWHRLPSVPHCGRNGSAMRLPLRSQWLCYAFAIAVAMALLCVCHWLCHPRPLCSNGSLLLFSQHSRQPTSCPRVGHLPANQFGELVGRGIVVQTDCLEVPPLAVIEALDEG